MNTMQKLAWKRQNKPKPKPRAPAPAPAKTKAKKKSSMKRRPKPPAQPAPPPPASEPAPAPPAAYMPPSEKMVAEKAEEEELKLQVRQHRVGPVLTPCSQQAITILRMPRARRGIALTATQRDRA
jgi:hypothetical protein